MNFIVLGQGRMGQRYSKVLRELYPSSKLFLVDPKVESVDVEGSTLFRRIEDLPKDQEIALAVDARPNFERAKTLMLLAQRGVRKMIVEKPHAQSLAESREMIEIEKRLGLQIMVPFYRDFSEIFSDSVLSQLGADSLTSIGMQSGAVGIGCNGVHLIHLCNRLMKAFPEAVLSVLDRVSIPSPRGPQFRDMGGLITLLYSNDRKAILNLSARSNLGTVTDLQYENGRIVILEGDKDSWHWFRGKKIAGDFPIYRTGSEVEIPPPIPYGIDLFELMRKGIRAFLEGRAYPNLSDAHGVLKVVALAVLSSREGTIQTTRSEPDMHFEFT